jgi:hypothetical protein
MEKVNLSGARRLLRQSRFWDSLGSTLILVVILPAVLITFLISGLHSIGVPVLGRQIVLDIRILSLVATYSAALVGVLLLLQFAVRTLNPIAMLLTLALAVGPFAGLYLLSALLGGSIAASALAVTLYLGIEGITAVALVMTTLAFFGVRAMFSRRYEREMAARTRKINPLVHLFRLVDPFPGMRRSVMMSIVLWPLFLIARAIGLVGFFLIADTLVAVCAELLGAVLITPIEAATQNTHVGYLILGAILSVPLVLIGLALRTVIWGSIGWAICWVADLVEQFARSVLIRTRTPSSKDGRAPILFLRSFIEGSVELKDIEERSASLNPLNSFRWLKGMLYQSVTLHRSGRRLDAMFLEEFGAVGPVPALAGPMETRQAKQGKAGAFGAERVFASNDHWQAEVLEIAERAAHIIVVTNATPGTGWEMELLAANPALRGKTLFLAPTRATRYAAGRRTLLTFKELHVGGEDLSTKTGKMLNEFAIGLAFEGDKPVCYTVDIPDGDGYQIAIQAFLRRTTVPATQAAQETYRMPVYRLEDATT